MGFPVRPSSCPFSTPPKRNPLLDDLTQTLDTNVRSLRKPDETTIHSNPPDHEAPETGGHVIPSLRIPAAARRGRAEIAAEDSDSDGLPDSFEQTIIDADPGDGVTYLSHVAGPNDFPTTTDFDGDGLSDADEYDGFTDPLDPDSDDDGLLDGPEVNGTDNVGSSHGFGPTDPLFEDSDFDMLLDGAEVAGTDNQGTSHGFGPTDPNSAFSDADFLEDGWEIENGLNPNSATGDDGDEGDPDLDGLNNLGEFDNFSDPLNPDTDGDHLKDGPEVAGTDNSDVSHGFGPTLPWDPDSDDDGFGDWLEIALTSDPNSAASLPGTTVPFVNGGFESPAVTPSGAGISISGGLVPGWSAVENDMYVTDVFTGAAVSAGNPTAANEGAQFATAERRAPDPDVDATAYVGGINATMSMRQDLDVSSLAAEIDAGARTIAVTFDFYDDDVYDNGIVRLEFLDASDASLGRQVSFRTDDVPEIAAWQTRSVSGYPPASTRSVRVTVEVIKAVVNTTSVRNVHFDDFRASLFHLDEDNDGMADDWEIANSLDPDDMTDAAGQDDADTLGNLAEFEAGTNPFAADTDGDGFNDDVELAAGSDPLDPSSVPALDSDLVVTAAAFDPEGDFVMTVSGLNPARNYRLMRGTDLAGFLFEVAIKQPVSETDSFTDADPPAGKAFYRVEEVSP
ncbi:hypothetical protein HNR46_003693 [Haloferula luteola]|uniref:Uncharacterized protein n=1 Tax=Haloferula luteola TaxID=595692 RepID=A0A840V632_9BACT|nr:thrombospondin type 3 repeat-containing protein [Haloferula luteola]MBB5353432.1 hypothetical protein [Haloferula luteola]